MDLGSSGNRGSKEDFQSDSALHAYMCTAFMLRWVTVMFLYPFVSAGKLCQVGLGDSRMMRREGLKLGTLSRATE